MVLHGYCDNSVIIMTLSWGILSAGLISHDFVTSLEGLKEHEIIAVATRQDLDRAQKFAKLFDIPKAYGSYEELAKDPKVQVVYVGVIHPLHYDACALMLNNGKHVLCEKPLCMNKKQVQKLTNLAKEKKLFLMEAAWSRFLPSYQYIKEKILNGELGVIKEVNVSFGFDLSNVERLVIKSLGGGATLDLGIYTIQLIQWAFREDPESITAKGTLNDEGVDTFFEAELKYSGDRLAKMKVSSIGPLDNQATIKGTKGQITLFEFWSCDKIIDIDGKEKLFKLPQPRRKTNFTKAIGLRYEAEEVRRCLANNKLESEDISHKESLLLAHIEDEIRRQLNVVYDADKE